MGSGAAVGPGVSHGSPSFFDTVSGNTFSGEVARGAPGIPGTEPLQRTRLTLDELPRPSWDPECSKEG